MSKGPRNPYPTVDVIIELAGGRIVLVERKNPPHGFALPGGFIDAGESAEQAAVREAREETGLEVELLEQFHTYSAPDRDPRHPSLSVVFIARASGAPKGADDAASARLCDPARLPGPMAFDHARIIADYLAYRQTGARGRFTLPRKD